MQIKYNGRWELWEGQRLLAHSPSKHVIESLMKYWPKVRAGHYKDDKK